jgi:hypothetical protein
VTSATAATSRILRLRTCKRIYLRYVADDQFFFDSTTIAVEQNHFIPNSDLPTRFQWHPMRCCMLTKRPYLARDVAVDAEDGNNSSGKQESGDAHEIIR